VTATWSPPAWKAFFFCGKELASYT
jgi:hypothetical protein